MLILETKCEPYEEFQNLTLDSKYFLGSNGLVLGSESGTGAVSHMGDGLIDPRQLTAGAF